VSDERHREAKRRMISYLPRSLSIDRTNGQFRKLGYPPADRNHFQLTELRKLFCPMMSVFNSGTNCLIFLLRQNPSSPSSPRPSFFPPLHPNPRFSDKRPNAVEKGGIHEKGSHTVRDESWCCTWLLYVAAGCTNTFTVNTYRTWLFIKCETMFKQN